MGRKLCSLVIVMLVSVVPAFAQNASSNWSTIENLKKGTKIVVTTKNGREYVGTKRQSTDDTLFMESKFAIQGNRIISLSKDEIAQVSKTKSKWFYQVIGIGIGVAVGVAIGDTYDQRGSDDPGMGKVLLGGIGGGAGLLGGSLLSRKPGIKTIYVAP